MKRTRKIDALLREVVEKIKTDYQPEKIILFGSYAYGKPTEDSDIDLLVIKKTDRRRVDRFVELSLMLHDPQRGISIQPLVYTPDEVTQRLARGDQFVEEILSRGEVLYAR